MRQIILDTETTGFEPRDGHRLVEVAALEMVNRQLTGKYYHSYINPERESDAGALNVHGLSSEFLADKPKFAAISSDLCAFIAGAELIIHNAPFDLKFLNHELGQVNQSFIADICPNVIDTLPMAKELFPGKRNSLDALCDRFEIDRSNRVLHGALIDCELLAEVYLAMTRGQDSLVMEPENTVEDTPLLNGDVRAGQRLLSMYWPNEAELAAHEAYLADLDKASKGQCVWLKLNVQKGSSV